MGEHWEIVGRDGFKETYRCVLPGGLGSTVIEEILAECAKQHLNEDEIRQGMHRARRDMGSGQITAGEDMHYVARRVSSDGGSQELCV